MLLPGTSRIQQRTLKVKVFFVFSSLGIDVELFARFWKPETSIDELQNLPQLRTRHPYPEDRS